jgi:D-sedoheptulose 7-phosphate isomerase
MSMIQESALQFPDPPPGGATQPVRLDAALAQSARAKARESCDVSARFFDSEGDSLVVMARALADVWRDGGRVFAMGNGASSCEAARFALEFQLPRAQGRAPLTAVDLAGDPALLSGLAADLGFEQIFARQVEMRARPGDGLIGFSVDGDALNLMNAFASAKARHVVTFGFAGGHGGKMRTSGLVDHCLVAPTSSAHRIQECHVAACHILWDVVHSLLADERGVEISGRA